METWCYSWLWYSNASLVCSPGSKGVKLVEQKVPASYVHLQDVVRDISEERKIQGKDPVLHTEQYRWVASVCVQ